MPDPRSIRQIQDRYDVEIGPDFSGHHRRRGWMCVGCFVLPLLLIVVWLASETETPYQSRPVSSVHRGVKSCQQCHTEWFQSLKCDLSNAETIRTMEAGACRSCHHDYNSTDHHQNAALGKGLEHPSCFVCHVEHRDADTITDVSDHFCIQCHQDPNLHSSSLAVTSFDSHPEIRIWNTDPPSDSTSIAFSHTKHLGNRPAPPGSVIQVPMDCTQCHQSTDGKRMDPINFEKHCQECHSLNISAEISDPTWKNKFTALPHERLDVLRGLIRDRLLERLENSPPPPAVLKPALPQKRVKKSESRPAWKFVEDRMGSMSEILDGKTKDLLGKTIGTCAQCHSLELDPNHPKIQSVTAASIRSSWYDSARFRHDKHDSLFSGPGGASFSTNDPRRCTQCHFSTAAFETPLASDSSSDVLMPRINVCKECHQSDTMFTSSPARADCIECHSYHHRGKSSSSSSAISKGGAE